jgi:hypothetical protein
MQIIFHKYPRSVARIAFLVLLSRIITYTIPLLILPSSSLTWNRWDSPHFLYLAQYGYTPFGDEANFIVFPPLWPLAIKAGSYILHNYELVAVISANALFVIGSVVFYYLVRGFTSPGVANKALFLLAIFPTSYFFSAPYTESLFFALAVSCLFAAYKKQWFIAGSLGGLAFLTRHPGIFLLPTLLIEVWFEEKQKTKAFFEILLPFLLCVGAYLYLNFIVFGNPLAFRTILENHWYKKPAPPWESIRGSWLAAREGLSNEYSRMIGLSEAIPATLSLLAIPFVYKHVKRSSYVFLYVTTVLFITSTSFLMSTFRYLLSIPPLFIALAVFFHNHILLYYLWIFISACLLTYFTLLFVGGHWAF